MNIDFEKLADAIKDKIGRKEIIAITTVICLTYLALNQVTEWKIMAIVLTAGMAGMAFQTLIDWKYPRNGTNGGGAAK